MTKKRKELTKQQKRDQEKRDQEELDKLAVEEACRVLSASWKECRDDLETGELRLVLLLLDVFAAVQEVGSRFRRERNPLFVDLNISQVVASALWWAQETECGGRKEIPRPPACCVGGAAYMAFARMLQLSSVMEHFEFLIEESQTLESATPPSWLSQLVRPHFEKTISEYSKGR